MKTCSVCGAQKPAEDFYTHSGRQCKTCKIERSRVWQQTNRERRNSWQSEYAKRPEVRERLTAYHRRYNAENYDGKRQRERALFRKYGLTAEQFNVMFDAQGGACAVCRRDLPLAVDHDHSTGKVRGLLCRACNTSLGHMEDDPDRLQAAINYLGRHVSLAS